MPTSSRRSPRLASTFWSKSLSRPRSPTPTACSPRSPSPARAGDQLALALVSLACHREAAYRRRRRSARSTEVHFYDGNRGPLYHRADKIDVSEDEVRRQKPTSWWYKRACRRRQPARLSRLWRDARHMVHERRGAHRSDRRRRPAGGPRGRRAFDHHPALSPRPFETRDAVGNLHRPLDYTAAAQMRLRHRRRAGTISSYDFEPRSACRRARTATSA